ncbi:MAG: hypothetical protein HN576_15300 [Bacteriovoracaceae bacterium]|jgi:hypothetical protein|nr:hypothetical protein [Bacteriovoracaceae bacterium]
MLNNLILLVFLFSSFQLFADGAIGFKSGSNLTSHYIYGNIYTYCPKRSRSHICRMDYLESGDRDKFIHPAIDANKVTLEARHQQGSRRSKKVSFDAVQGESKKYFNLWLGSLLQRPLLRSGKNTINYKLQKNGTIVTTGTFIVNVKASESKRCRDRIYHSQNDSDCGNPGHLCQRYFLEQAYCY